MNEQILLLRSYVRMIWPYRWLSLAAAALVAVAGWTYVYTMPNQYEVTAKIFIDTRSMLRPLLKGLAVDNSLLQDAALLMRRTLLTRPNLEEVARRTDLDLRTDSPEAFERLIDRLARDIRISGTGRDNIFEIKYVHAQPDVAKRVVDELLNTFLETALGDSRRDTAVTQKFLDEQIARYERELIEAEDRLKEFKRRNVGVMPGEGGDYYQKMQGQRDLLEQARLQLQEALQRRDELRRQLAGQEPLTREEAASVAAASPEVQRLKQRISDMEQRRDELLLQYTEKHPDVSATEDVIATLEQRLEGAIAETQDLAPTSDEGGGRNPNPVSQELKIQLSAAEGEVAALQTRVKEYEKRLEELAKLVNTVPEVEAELARLNRDYGLHKRQYEELIERREAARISQEADESADDIKLKVIEPPRVPLTPIGPDREKFISLVFLGSLGVGAGLAVLMSQIRPRFFTTEALKEFAGIPVLGGVSLVQSLKQRTERRMELAFFGLMLLMLVGVYGGLMALPILDIDLHAHVASLLREQA